MASRRRAEVTRQLQRQIVVELVDATVAGLLDQALDDREHGLAELDDRVHRQHCVVVDGAHQTMVDVDGEHVAVRNVLVPRGDVDRVEAAGNAALAQRLQFGDLFRGRKEERLISCSH